MTTTIDIPSLKLSRPAHRALAHAGIVTAAQLAAHSEAQVLALHGVGPKVLPELRVFLARAGLGFAEEG